jgi:hypothetical protein
VAVAAEGGAAARLTATSAEPIRACRSFGIVTAGVLAADVRFRVDAIGPGDVIITTLRDGGEEAASVRAGQGGTFVWYDGETRIRSDVAIQPGRWYRSSVGLDIGARRYSWRLADDAGDVLLEASNLALRDQLAGPVSEICVGTSSEAPGRGVEFDDVRLSR